MSTETMDDAKKTVLENIRGVRDALSVKRSFGEAYELDGVTIIPVARVAGGGGGGGGEGTAEDDSGSGFGTGFGMGTTPVGVYEVRGSAVEWKPSVDVNRIAKGGQVLAGIVTVCVTLVVLQRSRAT